VGVGGIKASRMVLGGPAIPIPPGWLPEQPRRARREAPLPKGVGAIGWVGKNPKHADLAHPHWQDPPDP